MDSRIKAALEDLTQQFMDWSKHPEFFYQTMRTYLVDVLKFNICIADGCVFMKDDIVIGLYVDDIIVTGLEKNVDEFAKYFQVKYKSRYSDIVDEFIGCELKWNQEKSSVILHQSCMINKLEIKMQNYIKNMRLSAKIHP